MAQFKVVMVVHEDIAGPVPDRVVKRFADAGIEFADIACTESEQIVDCASDADVIWVFGGSRLISADILPRLPRCRAILRSGAGTDNVPVDKATELGIVVAHTPETTMHPVSDHTIALLLALVRHVVVHDRWIREGKWEKFEAWPNWHLHGRTLGLVGFGRIARHVVEKTRGFNFKIVAFDPMVDAAVMAEHGVEAVSLDQLFEQSDFVSVHCPLTDQTHHIVDASKLRKMKPNAMLINTSRGKLIDEPALIRALSEGWIAAAALDVFETEPTAPDNPLLKMQNVVLTAHMAGDSDEFPDNFWDDSARTIVELSKDRMPPWYVNPKVKPRWQPLPG